MTDRTPLSFKIATESWEFEQIHRLNYKAFVEEIPQYPPNPEGILVDKFHDENSYIICSLEDRVLGMVAVRERRPFSLDQKLENLDSYLPEHRSACELRLLAVEKDYRNSRVFQGLFLKVCDYCETRGHDLAVVSGTVRQLRLYRQIGFRPFGPIVGSKEAGFQPMYLTLHAYRELQARSKSFLHLVPAPASGGNRVTLLPGPVAISRPVRQAFAEEPVSHRSKDFLRDFRQTQQLLCDLTGAGHAQIFLGSGTLANDVIAGQLSLLRDSGLILTNGEFGNRLVDHATRFQLSFRVLSSGWGCALEAEDIRRALDEDKKTGWLWAVHCETSSGVLNDVNLLRELCSARNIRLCLDCISSIGTVPVDLHDVYLASCVSGKALASFPGLAVVFYNHDLEPAPDRLPRCLDMALYAASNGVPFTTSSNLVNALKTALQRFDHGHFETLGAAASRLREELRAAGFYIVGSSARISPAVTTIAIPQTISSEWLGRKLSEAGYQLSYRSRYLRERNWLQICLMGEAPPDGLSALVALMGRLCSGGRQDDAVQVSP